MFFKESLSKRILAVYSFFKDVILYNTNNLAHYHHSNEITVSYLKELLSEFKDMQEEKSFKYNFISTDDGEVSDLSIVITRFLYPTESTISKSIPILLSLLMIMKSLTLIVSSNTLRNLSFTSPMSIISPY